MTHTRTLLTAAMALSLAGCATSSTADTQLLADLPRAYQSEGGQTEAQKQLSRAEAQQPQGQVVLTRTEEAQPAVTPEDVQKQLNEATAKAVAEARAAADAAVTKAKKDALAEIDTRFQNLSGQTTHLLTQTAEVIRSNAAVNNTIKQSEDVRQQMNLATAMAVAEARKEAETAVTQAKKEADATLARAREEAQAAVARARQEAVAEVEAKFSALTGQTGELLNQTSKVLANSHQVLLNSNQVLASNNNAQQSIARQQLKNWQQAEEIRLQNQREIARIDAHVSSTLANVADVITKDNRVVFAIRKVVADQLAVNPQAGNETAMGDIHMDSAALTISKPQEPGAGMIGSLASISPAAGPSVKKIVNPPAANALRTARNRKDWIDLRKYHVVMHEDGKTLEELMTQVLSSAEPFTGPWHIKWKLSEENRDLLQEQFSLDVETSFDQFVSYLAQYMVNDRGIKMTFSLFDADRVIVISD